MSRALVGADRCTAGGPNNVELSASYALSMKFETRPRRLRCSASLIGLNVMVITGAILVASFAGPALAGYRGRQRRGTSPASSSERPVGRSFRWPKTLRPTSPGRNTCARGARSSRGVSRTRHRRFSLWSPGGVRHHRPLTRGRWAEPRSRQSPTRSYALGLSANPCSSA
jgi:hypothetical protein